MYPARARAKTAVMRTSQALIDYLERREEFSATPYLDAAGVWTIGYGHVIRPHEKKSLTLVTDEQAERLMLADVAPMALYLDSIQANFKTPLSQHQFDAVVSLIFNIGLRAFENSTILKRLREGDFAAAAAEFDRWIFVTRTGRDGVRRKVPIRGLVNRRRMDRAIFERGEYA